MFKKIKQILN